MINVQELNYKDGTMQEGCSSPANPAFITPEPLRKLRNFQLK